jgi:uncharacterized membrane protein YeaQ/YmgE (transglycosylase-associated protein family)
LIKTGTLKSILELSGVGVFGSFIAGLFFTSVFTVAPATVALGEIAREGEPIFLTVILGGFGAMLGDLLIFRFVKNNLSQDFSALIKYKARKRLSALFKLKLFRWFIAFLGALVVASPLPDELGLAMMGLTKVKTIIFIPLSFALNSFGILIICLIARAM